MSGTAVQETVAVPEPRLFRPAPDVRGLRGLALLLRTRVGLVSAAALTSVVGTALALVPFFCVAKMATAIYSRPAKLGDVRALAFVALASVTARYGALAISSVLSHVAAFRILHDLRIRIAKKLGDVPLSFFATRTSGEVKRAMMDDVNQVESFLAHHFPDGVSALVVPIATAVALFSVDWRMAIASIAVAPLAFAAMAVAMREVGAAHKKWFQIQDRTNNAVLEYFRGIHVIKTFGLTAKSFGDLARSIDDGLDWMVEFMRTNGRGYGLFGALIGSSLLVLMPVGGWLFSRGSLSLEHLVLFLILGPQLLGSLLRLMFAWGNVQRIEEGNARIAKILRAPDLVEWRISRIPANNGIVFQGVSFRYGGGKDALTGVSFAARPNCVTALVGPSGAGKTTIARLIPRLWEATAGRVEIGGVDIVTLSLDSLLSRIAVVFQDVFLFYGSVRENLLIARPEATEQEIVAACTAARAHDFIEALPQGYATLLGERGVRLSGGERQRLSIARAILKDAPILLLDEATAFADAENEGLIQDALGELCGQRTVLVIAHRLSTIVGADQIVVLDEGRVVDTGRHEELLGRCLLYQNMWQSHSDAIDWTLDVSDSGGREAVAS